VSQNYNLHFQPTLCSAAVGLMSAVSCGINMQVERFWAIGSLIAITIPLVIVLAAVGLCCLVVWINLHTFIWRGRALWKKKSASGKSLRVRMLGKRSSSA
jgi:uncharacterized membrane protein YqaE (UPF0057 family)